MTSSRIVCTSKRALLAIPVALLTVFACHEDADSGAALQATLTECGLLSSGRPPSVAKPTTPLGICVNDCLASLGCSDLEVFVCDQDSSATDQCRIECLPDHGFACDGEVYPPHIECDGLDDCEDGTDELDCPPPFVCDGGTEYPARYECDGMVDCEDGTDEASCQTFTCDDGTEIFHEFECDYQQDCPDASDEIGCALPICDSGETG